MSVHRADSGAKVRLHLLRHAHAGDAFEWIGDDDLRPLTKKGRRQAERLGSFLEAHAVRPDVIITSPLVLSLIHISEPTRPVGISRMPSSA